MKRKHKKYSKPKKLYDKGRIEEESGIKKEFGLKNKREIWKAEAKVKSIREKAKKMILANQEEQKYLFEKLKEMEFKVNSISDVWSLEKNDYLKRRLQTIISKKFNVPIKKARQLIVHKKVLVGDDIVDSPSYLVQVKTENVISLKKTKNQNPISKLK